MENYSNLNGNSSVTAFEIGQDFIIVTFSDGSQYLYTYRSAGGAHIEQMKNLARAGRGLNSYIMRYVKTLYEKKLR